MNFYGRNSEYIISGSDCGHVFIWEKNSEKCIWYDKGDYDGTVNVLEPHPYFPIIATSGLEHDVKIWQPISEKAVDFKRLKSVGIFEILLILLRIYFSIETDHETKSTRTERRIGICQCIRS